MADKPDKEFLFVVIYPYKFTNFLYGLLELNDYKPYCDVIVLDISMITTPKFFKEVSAKSSEKDEVVTLSSLLSFIRRIYELKKRSAKTKICILNEVPYSSPFEFICNLIITVFLRRTSIAILDLYNGGVPIHYFDDVSAPNRINENSNFYAKVLRFFKNNSTLLEAGKKILSVLLGSLARLVPSATTHRLVAGEDWLKIAVQKKRASNQVRLVFGHSHDYSNNLLHTLKSSILAPLVKKAVLLDASGPMYASDAVHMGRKVYFTSDVWYPSLTRFFDKLEDKTGVQIEIAGHYKSTHPAIAPCFGNRVVHYCKTRELVRSSEFVITRASTAISYAVMFKKPIIFIYSNQLKKDHLAMRNIYGMAEMFGKEPVNIDEPLINIEHLFKIDEERYRNYEKVCLTSTNSRRPNVQIVIEDIMNISTGSDFMRAGLDRTIK
jgi:hypothetical protein